MTTTTNKLKLSAAISLVISSMVGTGVFTSLGFQVGGTPSVFAILILWLVGGIVAICGALNYSELATAMPRSGGEYNYLSKIYHPLLGFLSAFVSSLVGFAAPAALSAMAFAKYFKTITAGTLLGNITEVHLAVALITLITVINSISLKVSAALQTISTALNLGLILLFVLVGIWHGANNSFAFTINATDINYIFSNSFATSLIYVSYAYSGWNSAIYIAGEIKNPEVNLTRSLVGGAGLVMIMYIALNLVFMLAVPLLQLSGQLEVGFIASQAIFGGIGSKIVSAMICVALLASVCSYSVFGPRVLQTLGHDYKVFSIFGSVTHSGIPVTALLLQSFISVLLILTASFDSIMTYIGMILGMFTFMVVLGVALHRYQEHKKGNKIKATWGYPITTILFLIIEGWTILFAAMEKTTQSFTGLLTLVVGSIVFFIATHINQQRINE
jgi:basic amino acid/polyamine antiporter, APA family